MLSGVLLHVIAAAFAIDDEVHQRVARDADLCGSRINVVDDSPAIRLRDFRDPKTDFVGLTSKPTGVVQLATTGRIEGTAVQDHADTLALGSELDDLGVELQQSGVGVVEALGHERNSTREETNRLERRKQ